MASAASVGASDSALYEVAYGEAARALAEQLSLVDSFRTRAGLLLPTSAIATSLLGGQALDSGGMDLASWAALGSFFVVAALSLAILWPRLRESSADANQVIEKFIEAEEPASVVELRRALTLQMQRSYVKTWKDIGQLAILFEVASGMLIAELILWTVALID